MGERGPSLQAFLASLGRCLQELTPEEIRTALLAHAASLSRNQRDAFLRIFTAQLAPADGPKPTDLIWPVGDDPLLADVDAFLERLAAGKYFDGFSWDDEPGDESSFDEESWVWEMDALFAGAQNAFLAGELGLAREAYRRLLEALGLDQEVGMFSGTLSAEAMLETDVWEAEARYLRAVYETTPRALRATVLAEEWSTLWIRGGGPSLRAVREARQDDLAELEVFLPGWIAQLRSLNGPRDEIRTLLVEAVELHGGVDGLAALARDSAPGQPECYLDWLDALRRVGRGSDAAAAAREALDRLDPHGKTPALIAEQLAALATDPAEVLDARRAAWRAAPTQKRLLALHQAATVTGQAQPVMTAEADALPVERIGAQLRAVVLLLAGRTEAAIELLDGPAGAGPGRGAARVLVPYLLTAGCAGPTRPRWRSSRLAKLLGGVDTPDAWDWTAVDQHAPDSTTEAAKPLSVLLTEQLADIPDDRALRLRRLHAALGEIGRRVESVVQNLNRGQYAPAARLIACAAEAVTLEKDQEAGTLLIAHWRDRYPRHVAFRRELELAVKKTPLVLAPTAKGRR